MTAHARRPYRDFTIDTDRLCEVNVMTFGNPHQFAVLAETIKGWNNDDTFCNGLLLFFVDGCIYPNEIVTATLRCEIEPLKQKLASPAIDKRLYDLPAQLAFSEIYNITFPDSIDAENDSRFDISPPSLSDHGCFLFSVSDGTNIRILASKLKYKPETSRHNLYDIAVSEAHIAASELNEIVIGLDDLIGSWNRRG